MPKKFIKYDNDERFDDFLEWHLHDTFRDFKKKQRPGNELPQLFIVMDDNLPVGYFLLNSVSPTALVWYADNFEQFPKRERDVLYDLAIVECEKYGSDMIVERLKENKQEDAFYEFEMAVIERHRTVGRLMSCPEVPPFDVRQSGDSLVQETFSFRRE